MGIIFLAALLALVLGLAFCFLGIRTLLVFLPVWAFFAGFWLGARLTSFTLQQGFIGTYNGIIAGLLLGVIFAVVAYLKFPFGIALVSGAFGAAVANGILQALGFSTGIGIALAVVAVVVLIVWLLFRYEWDRILIMAITALGGASLLLLAPMLLLGRVTPDELLQSGSAIAPIIGDSWLWLLTWLALSAAGFFVQWRTSHDFMFTTHDLVQGWS
ncbi:MAG: hypothetical protein ACK2T4_09400 [Candidatus Promineifilaceae bacterium]|jgi:hypothetical protein